MSIPRFAAALALAFGLASCTDASRDQGIAEQIDTLDRPNVVLIVVDTLRADWLEPYGGEEPVSPELSRWASRGIVFENVLAQSSWTKTSMASFLTSLWPRSHGVHLPTDGLGDDAILLAEVFRDAGYATAAVQSNGWLEQSFGFQQGFDHYAFPRARTAKRLGFSSVWPHRDRVLEEAERLLDDHDPQRPLFLYLHFMDVHEYASPPEYRSFGNHEKGFYLAAIRWVDEGLRHLEDMLAQRGLLEDTVLALASDHGEAFGENQAHGHAMNVFSPVLRVPLLIKLPFDVPPVRIPSQIRNVDVAPTLLDLAGVPVPEGFEGLSAVPLVTDEGSAGDRPSFASLEAHIMLTSQLQAAVNDGQWTFVRDLEEPEKQHLFELAVDPWEDVNLIDLEPELAEPIREVLDAHERESARSGVRRREVRIDPSIAERLRAVGYLQ